MFIASQRHMRTTGLNTIGPKSLIRTAPSRHPRPCRNNAASRVATTIPIRHNTALPYDTTTALNMCMAPTTKLINWQRSMIKVLIGTVPINLAAIYMSLTPALPSMRRYNGTGIPGVYRHGVVRRSQRVGGVVE